MFDPSPFLQPLASATTSRRRQVTPVRTLKLCPPLASHRRRVSPASAGPELVSSCSDRRFSVVERQDESSLQRAPAGRPLSPLMPLAGVRFAAGSVPLRAIRAAPWLAQVRRREDRPDVPLRSRRIDLPRRAVACAGKEPYLQSHAPGHYSFLLLLKCQPAA